MNKTVLLKEVAKIQISNVDKKTDVNEIKVKLCNFTDVYYNWSITRTEYDTFMEASAKKEEINKFSLKKDMVAITKDSETRNDIGMSTYIADDFENVLLGYHCALIEPQKDILSGKYLNALLSSSYGRKVFSNNATGSGQRYTLGIETIETLKIPLIPIKLQEKIGDLFQNIDNKIKKNNNINKELESLAKTIYDYWFLQFDFPDQNGKPYKSSGGKMAYNEMLKREIPEEWKVENLHKNSLTKIIKPGLEVFEKKEYIATGDVENNEIISSSVIEYETRESRANMQPIENSVWFAKMKKSIKHLYFGEYSKEMLEKYILSTGFCGLHCKNNSMEYINSYINSEYFEAHKDKLAHGATQEAVNNDDLKSIKLVIPSEEVLLGFCEKTAKLFEKIYLNKLENQKLVALRDFLLPLLMNGQVGFQ